PTAPTLVAATCPSLNSMRVGMPRTPYFCGVCGLSSMLILAMVTRPSISAAISSRAGAIILQGPHHSAQKSTRTGPEAFKTSCSKVPSLVALVLMQTYPCDDDALAPAGPRVYSELALNVGSACRKRQGA